MSGDRTRRYHAPSALRLGATEGRPNARIGLGHTAGVGHLVEAIGGCNRADLHRLKENLVVWIHAHKNSPTGR